MKTRKLKIVPLDEHRRAIKPGSNTLPCEWMVCVGKRLSGRKRERRFFRSLRDARAYCAQVEEIAERHGRAILGLAQEDLIQLAASRPRIEAAGVDVATVIEAGLAAIRSKQEPVGPPLAELRDAYLATKTRLSYRKAQSYSVDRFLRDFGGRHLADIQTDELEHWIDQMRTGPVNKRNIRRDMRMFLAWVGNRLRLPWNPIAAMRKPPKHRSPVAIYSVDEAARLLAASHELKFLEFYALALFSGVRVEEITGRRYDEWRRLPWSAINVEQSEILLDSRIAKTEVARPIRIHEPLTAWLPLLSATTGYVVTQTRRLVRALREKVHERAGVAWRRNALRHTYASYHAAHHRQPGELRMQLGHDIEDVLWRHYITTVSRAEAARYWSLTPEAVLGSRS